MMNFNQFFNLINGEPYESIPDDYTKPVTSGEDTSAWALQPLGDDDMARYGTDDVVDHIEKMRSSGFNPTRLGPPMTDDEFANYTGMN